MCAINILVFCIDGTVASRSVKLYFPWSYSSAAANYFLIRHEHGSVVLVYLVLSWHYLFLVYVLCEPSRHARFYVYHVPIPHARNIWSTVLLCVHTINIIDISCMHASRFCLYVFCELSRHSQFYDSYLIHNLCASTCIWCTVLLCVHTKKRDWHAQFARTCRAYA